MAVDASRTPTASIIISAYNRADVLRYAIKSVLRSTYTDWELLVVGDGCTDHSEETVRSFADPRITFQNLPENTGGQSAPHNVGVAQARGKYILFLNQDDMYCADHVAKAVTHMEETGADFSWSPMIRLVHSGLPSGPPDAAHDVVTLVGGVHDGQYEPRLFLLSSSWIVKRDACATVGPWKSAEETYHTPSQEWLFRARQLGLRFSYQPYPSVLVIHSGAKRLAYLRSSPENDRAWTWIAEEDSASADLLRCVAVSQAGLAHQRDITVPEGLWHAIVVVLKSRAVTIMQRIGLQPYVLRSWLVRRRKGDTVANWRTITMEADRLVPGKVLRIGEAAADPYLMDGWHKRETSGRWTSGPTADVIFRVDPADIGHSLELTGHTLRHPGSATFLLNGKPSLTHRYYGREETIRIGLGTLHGNVRLTINVENPTSPQALGTSQDGRTLGLWVSSIRLVPGPA